MKMRVKEIRKSLGITQVMLAEAAGVTQSTISKLELNRGHGTLANLSSIAVALGVEVVDLFEPSHAHAEAREIANASLSMPPEQRSALLVLIRAMPRQR